MSYNPSGDKLAVGSHDNRILVYNAKDKYRRIAILKGHNSFITSFDWSLSENPTYMRSICGAYELLFFNVDNGK